MYAGGRDVCGAGMNAGGRIAEGGAVCAGLYGGRAVCGA